MVKQQAEKGPRFEYVNGLAEELTEIVERYMVDPDVNLSPGERVEGALVAVSFIEVYIRQKSTKLGELRHEIAMNKALMDQVEKALDQMTLPMGGGDNVET